MFFSADWQPWRIDHGDFNMAVVLATGNELPRNGPRTMRNFLRLFLQFRWRPITRNSNMARLGLVIVPLCNLCHGTAAQAPPFQKIERCPVHKLLLIAQPLKHPTSDSKYGHPSLCLSESMIKICQNSHGKAVVLDQGEIEKSVHRRFYEGPTTGNGRQKLCRNYDRRWNSNREESVSRWLRGHST